MPFFFPRQEFNPLFALAEELNKAANPQRGSCAAPSKPTRSFAPRFDVKETDDAYELYGDLPGVEQSNINIEWNEDNVLTISGHSERHAESKTPAIEAAAEPTTTADEDGDIDIVDNDDAASEHSSNYHSPTVEDEDAAGAAKPATATVDTTKGKQAATQEPAKPQQPAHRYWVSERSYGSFTRSFQFPSRVEQEAVKASFKNGVLSISVPKAKAREPRRIVIQ